MILRKSKGFRSPASNAGMTFVELLVVLLILAILSAVALRSTTGLAEQARHESTIRTLENIEEAILGPRPWMRQSHSNSPIITGFVADIGRLPRAVDPDPFDPDNPLQPQELWDRGALAPFAVYSFTDPDHSSVTVQVPAGWRGPYLALSPGQDELKDGWGNEFQLFNALGNQAGEGDPIVRVRSLGRDNLPGGVEYDADTEFPGKEIDGSDYQAVIKIEVTGVITDGEGVIVRMYGPDPVTGEASVVLDVTATEENGHWNAEFSSASVTQGPRVFRAFQDDPDSPALPDRQSLPVQLFLLPGLNPPLTLDMQ